MRLVQALLLRGIFLCKRFFLTKKYTASISAEILRVVYTKIFFQLVCAYGKGLVGKVGV